MRRIGDVVGVRKRIGAGSELPVDAVRRLALAAAGTEPPVDRRPDTRACRDHRGVDQLLLLVVAILARRAALAEPPRCRRLVGQRASRQVELGLLPPFGVLEQVVVDAERDALPLRGPIPTAR